MGNGFFSLDIALRGLYAAQRNLDIVGHNINNINTPGYSRQVAVQKAARPESIFDGTGMLGTGVQITGVNRIRDEYLDFKFWSESSTFGEWEVKRQSLADIEAIFNEPSDSGFTTIMTDFFSSMQELSKDPSNAAIRSVVKERGVALTKYFNSTANLLEKVQADLNYKINAKVSEINSLATQIQQTNKQIYSAELDSNMANDLRDQRTVLIDELSQIVDIEVTEYVAGKLPSGRDDIRTRITIGGKSLIDHFGVSRLTSTQRENKLNEDEDISNLYEIQWEDGNEINIRGGELKGYIDVRDGNDGKGESPNYKGVPHYIGKLNEFVRTFAMGFNEGYFDYNSDGIIQPGEVKRGHVNGFGLPVDSDDSTTSPTGIRFFTMTDENNRPLSSEEFMDGATWVSQKADRYKLLTAKNFAVGEEILSDYKNIATSSVQGETGNIDNLRALLEIRQDTNLFTEGAPEDFMQSIVSSMAVDSQQAVRFSRNQEIIVKQIENRRLSVSGVSIDEEMTNLVKFQHSYNAAAKMVSTISELYDILINSLGV